ncbi:MAG: hypothetical protein OEV66_08890, partial [Spirochaetia bacterium]|nr:hypothetical protein [Spirochaetia bacterium]
GIGSNLDTSGIPNGVITLGVAATILVAASVAASAVGLSISSTKATKKNKPSSHIDAAIKYLNENSAAIQKDFYMAEGITFQDWGNSLQLTPSETKNLKKNLEASKEQMKLVHLLGQKITRENFFVFSSEFHSVLKRSLPQNRLSEIEKQSIIAMNE